MVNGVLKKSTDPHGATAESYVQAKILVGCKNNDPLGGNSGHKCKLRRRNIQSSQNIYESIIIVFK